MVFKSPTCLKKRLKVINQLLESVNSQEEFESLEKEKREVSLELLK
jgi:hypothetical protein